MAVDEHGHPGVKVDFPYRRRLPRLKRPFKRINSALPVLVVARAAAVWDRAIIQTCVIHLLRNTFRYVSRRYWDQIAKDIRPVYTAATEAAAKERFVEFTANWGAQYPAIIRLWENAWSEFVPFLDYDVEIRRVICSTNAIESINARYRRAIRARGHFPTEQAALKCLYLVTRSLDPTGRGKARWAMRWKPALNAFAITFNGRITPTAN